MKNMTIKQKTTAIAVMGAAAVFGMLSFGNNAEAARYSSTCQTLSGVLGPCCDRMMGSQLINVYGDCHEHKIIIKRRLTRPTLTVIEAFDREGGGNGGDGDNGKDNGPKAYR
jgi:hypothetical protein